MSDLLERDRELATIDQARASAVAGRGSLLLVEGAAGVGKSVLLGELGRRARADSMRVLHATGGELERDFPFGVVRQLLEGELLGTSDERRTLLLSGAAQAAGPALGLASGEQSVAPDAGFATLHGLYWLVAALAEEEPLLLVLDDAHWADAPSLRFADFLARRVADLSVLVAVGLRPREPGAEHALLGTLAESDAATVLRPAPLSAEGTRALVADQLGAQPSAEAAEAAHQTTGGNPLLLRELVRDVGRDDAQLSAGAVRDAVPSSVTASVERRLARLPADVRQVAAALAILGDATLLAQATDLGEGQVLDALDALRGPELVAGEPAAFAHPLLREAVADTVPVSERHRLHHAAVQILHARGDAGEQLVVHLLAGPALGQAWAVDELRQSGRRALAEGAPDAAVVRLRRALDETPDPSPDLVLELGLAESSAGDPAAFERLAEAERGDDPLVTARAAAAQVALASLTVQPDVAAHSDRLAAALEGLGPKADADLVDELTGVLLNSLARDPQVADRRRDIIAATRDRAGPSVLGTAAMEELNRDATAAEVKAMAEAALASRPLQTPHKIPGGAQTAVACLAAVDEPDLADQALRDSEETSRRVGSRLYGALTAATRGEWALLYGTLTSAEDSARHSYELLEEMGGAVIVSVTRSTAAIALTRQNRLDEADAVLGSPDPGDQGWPTILVLAARAELRLAQQRPAEALADAEAAAGICAAFGWREFALRPRSLHAAILLAADRRPDALAMAAEEVDFSRRTGRLSAEAAALTVLGRAQEGPEALETLRTAHETAERSPVPLVRAQAALELGAALRREGQRAESRALLREAGERAASIGAALVRERALEELAVAGGRRRDPFSTGTDSLTPSERRVADHAARGLTNREIAETLFVTQKTVEVHLGNTYAKLGIRSRSQLPDALR